MRGGSRQSREAKLRTTVGYTKSFKNYAIIFAGLRIAAAHYIQF